MLKPRITLRMIAKEIGRDVATVSMALRNDPRLLPETIATVKKTAERLGYVPDAAASSVMSRLRVSGRASSGEVLAYLHARPIFDNHEGSSDGSDPYFAGAAAEAVRQGYKLDEFQIDEATMTPRRLSQILRARGIRGVLIAPFREGQTSFDMEWEKFSVVALGASLHKPAVNRVSNGQYTTMRLAVEKLVARGYRRIGFAIDRVHNERLHGAFLGAYLTSLYSLPAEERPAPLLLEHDDVETIRQWVKKETPDVIISGLIYDLYKSGKLGEGVFPRGIAFVGTDVSRADVLSGIFQNHEHDGAEAVRMLVGQLLRNEYGIPASPMTYTTFGAWHEGITAPKKNEFAP